MVNEFTPGTYGNARRKARERANREIRKEENEKILEYCKNIADSKAPVYKELDEATVELACLAGAIKVTEKPATEIRAKIHEVKNELIEMEIQTGTKPPIVLDKISSR